MALEIQGWLYRPRGEARGLVVWVHGGPNLHSGDEIDTLAQCMVAGGFAVLDPNYRGQHVFRCAVPRIDQGRRLGRA